MTNAFQPIFSQEPTRISDGAYYFQTPVIPGFDLSYAPENEVVSRALDPEDSFAERKARSQRELIVGCYESRDIQAPYDSREGWRFQRFLQGAEANQSIVDVIRRIAEKGVPFLDLGSYHMGLAPYILHLNPSTPCLLTNRDPHYVRVLGSCLPEKLGQHHILAAFCDETAIPLRRQSIDTVTGVLPLSGASQNRVIDSRSRSLDEMRQWCILNVLLEVHRVLRPGGYFIFSEFSSSWHIAWAELSRFFEEHDTIYGRFAKEEFYDLLRGYLNQETYGLHDAMIRVAGFDIEIKDSYSFKDAFENPLRAEYMADSSEPDPSDGLVWAEYTESFYVVKKRP